MAYSKEVVERFESVLRNPAKHAVGKFNPQDADIATGMVGAPSCGDVMKLQLKLDQANDPDKAKIFFEDFEDSLEDLTKEWRKATGKKGDIPEVVEK